MGKTTEGGLALAEDMTEALAHEPEDLMMVLEGLLRLLSPKKRAKVEDWWHNGMGTLQDWE